MHDRKRPSYHSVVSVSDDETELFKAKDDTDTDTDTDIEPSKKTAYKHKTFCQYLCQNTLSKAPLLYFLIGIAASLADAVFYFMDKDTGYIVAGVLGASLSFYGLKHFYTLLNLKKSVDAYNQLNVRFEKERNKLSHEVDRVSNAGRDLKDTQQRLRLANAKNRENLENFREIQTNMEAFGQTSVEELSHLHERSSVIEKKWRESLYEHERSLLHTVFERVERQGSRLGMNIGEFEDFTNQLPDGYKGRFDRLGTFSRLSKGSSLMQYDDFKVSLDLFAEMKVDNVDIEFSVRKTKTKKKKQGIMGMSSLGVEHALSALSEGDEPKNPQIKPWNQRRIKTIDLTLSPDRSIDYDDIEYDEDEADAPALYDRHIVITKRTIRGNKMKEDLLSLLDDSDKDDDDEDEDAAAANMFGRVISAELDPLSPKTPGIQLRRKHFKVTDEKVGLKSLGVRKFTNLLDDVDD